MNICILGDTGNYTKFIIAECIKHNIDFDLVIIKQLSDFKTKYFVPRIIFAISNFFKEINNHTYKALPKYSLFFWKKYIKEKLYKKSSSFNELVKEYSIYKFDHILLTKSTLIISNYNENCILNFLKNKQYDIGVLGGFPIISKTIVDCFNICINAHPAPLPECRGGGAIEHTLLYGLSPATTVHKVNHKIDGGEIIEVRKINLTKNDNYYSIETKLKIEGAKLLAETVLRLIKNEPINFINNTGKLHYFKDCGLKKQKIAHSRLSSLINSMK